MFIHSKRRTMFLITMLVVLALGAVSVASASAPRRGSQEQAPTTPNIGAAIAAELVPVRTLLGGEVAVTEVVFSLDSTLLAAASPDGVVRVWQVSDGALRYELEGHTAAVNSVAFSTGWNAAGFWVG